MSENTHYDFVFYENHWHLKIDDLDQLAQCFEQMSDTWIKALFRTNTYENTCAAKNDKKALHIMLVAEYNGLSPSDAVQKIRLDMLSAQMDAISAGKTLLINPSGGYQFAPDDMIFDNYTCRKHLVFPHFTENDIRVKQFPGGDHFYAYIGDIWVKNGDVIKYDTKDEAFTAAERLIKAPL